VSTADITLYAPVTELADTGDLVPNREEQIVFPKGGKPRRRRPSIEHPALDLYAGNSLLLVRTALIRAEGYDPKNLPTVDTAWAAADLLRHLQHADQEHLVTLSLNSQNQVNAIHEVSIGTATATMQTADNILKVAFLTGARGLIIAHNHPSGIPTPSRDDLDMTQNCLHAAACVGLSLLDSLIIARDGWVSLRSLAERKNIPWSSEVGADLAAGLGSQTLLAAEPW